MSFPTNPIVTPDSMSIAILYGFQGTGCTNGIQETLVPKNPDGTVFNTTDATLWEIIFDNGLSSLNPQSADTSFAPQITEHDAVGLTFNCTPAQLQSVITGLTVGGPTGGRVALYATDAIGTKVLVGRGNWAVTPTAG